MPAEAAALAARLVNGQRWITDAYDRLLALPDGGTRENFDRWYQQLHRWDSMARIFMAYRLPQCIHGEGQRCPTSAVADCVWCGEQRRAR